MTQVSKISNIESTTIIPIPANNLVAVPEDRFVESCVAEQIYKIYDAQKEEEWQP